MEGTCKAITRFITIEAPFTEPNESVAQNRVPRACVPSFFVCVSEMIAPHADEGASDTNGGTMNARYSYCLNVLSGVAALCALEACSTDLTGANMRPVQLSFTTRAAPGGGSGISASPDLVIGPAGDLVLTKVQLVLGKIELGEDDDVNCVEDIESGDDHDDINDDHEETEDECEEVSRDPLLVDIPADAAVHSVITVPLTEGTYRKLEAKLESAREAAFNSLNPTLAGKSVRVEGTFRGKPFVFTSAVRSSLDMEFAPPLVIDATTKNATISIDVAKWFVDRNGAVIDPSHATQASDALDQIEDNIRRSFHAFEDDDESGMDDHEEHRG